MGLKPAVLKALQDMGFEQPTSIQARVIPAVLSADRDVIGRAQTGTGKTGAFGIPIINRLDLQSPHVQALILCPTRELCLQITQELQHIAQFIPEIKVIPVYGGARIDTQIFALKQRGQIVVGTPGRTLDLINRQKLNLNHIQWLVLDEADEMLSMGFKDDLDAILATAPKERQSLLLSATFPKEIMRIVNTYMHDPMEVKAEQVQTGAENVTHHFYEAQAKDRFVALKRILDAHPDIYAIIFCRTRAETKDIAAKLSADGYDADALHGDLSQEQREHAMSRFRNRSLQLLVATDVAARGLDVSALTHVINYNLPDDPDTYIHRSGRTGRAEHKGISVSIIHSREHYRIRDLERKVGKSFTRKSIPTGFEICEKQLFFLVDKIEKVEPVEAQMERYMPAIFSKLSWLDREELIRRFMWMEFSRFLDEYKDARDINVGPSPRPERRQDQRPERKTDRRAERKPEPGSQGKKKWEAREEAEFVLTPPTALRGANRPNRKFAKLSINLGKVNAFKPKSLLELINEKLPNQEAQVGKIDIQYAHTVFDVDEEFQQTVVNALRQAKWRGKDVEITEIGGKRKDKKEKTSFRERKAKKGKSRR